jgi:hypothetical protein
MAQYKFASIKDYAYRYFTEYFEMLIYSFAGFFIPLLIGHPQILVGIVVNAMLIAAAINLKGHKLLPVIVMPSLGVLCRGLIFGPFTWYMVYLIPFIWIGNSMLVFAFKQRHSFVPKLIAGAALKSGFLFLGAYLLFKLSIIPVIFLAAMGWMQLVTAIGGGMVALGMVEARRTLLKAKV